MREVVCCRNGEETICRTGRETIERILQRVLWVAAAPDNLIALAARVGGEVAEYRERSGEVSEAAQYDSIFFAAVAQRVFATDVAAVIFGLKVILIGLLWCQPI